MKILISACLLGSPVRYNATDLLLEHSLIKKWQAEDRLVPLCPEVAGGLPVPRRRAEINSGDGLSVLQGQSKVLDKSGEDVTEAFVNGAHHTLEIAQQHNCVAAILTERSPSCGSQQIYDGSFSGARKSGVGVTTALLEQNSIKVFNQYQLEQLESFLKSAKTD